MKLHISFYLAVLFFASPVFAESSLKAHLHGHVELNVAADGKTLFLEVHSPSQSFLGFEQKPQTNQQNLLAVRNASSQASVSKPQLVAGLAAEFPALSLQFASGLLILVLPP